VQGIDEAACEKGLLEGFALGCGLAWGDVWAEDRGVAQAGKPGEGGGFDVGFCEGQGEISIGQLVGRSWKIIFGRPS